jgi:hypothetical protein
MVDGPLRMGMIPAIVESEEQNRLLDLYILARGYYSYANELVKHVRGQSDLFEAAQRRAEQAKIKCEAARQALMKHREEHGC